MKLALIVSSGLAVSLAGGGAAHAANIYMLSCTDPVTDSAAAAALTARGHTVTIGVDYLAFDGSISLAGFQTVYLQNNFNWGVGLMPTAGQQQLVDWVNAGGRLVTCEWVTYYSASNFSTLGVVLPNAQTFLYGNTVTATYTSVTPDPLINAGLPASFTFPLYSYAGTEVFADPKPGATVYYSTSNSATAAGLSGWTVGAGRVFSFGSTCGPDQVNDPGFVVLFGNVMGPTGGPAPCYANCDNSTTAPVLNVQDFTCFLNKFASAETYANCDGSTTVPALNVQDFTCFLNRFSTGCS